MKVNKIAYCDTGYIIRLVSSTDPLHKNAVEYFQHFLTNENCIFRMSSIALAEYLVKGKIEELPLNNIQLVAFNPYDATFAGDFADILFQARSKGVLQLQNRIMIQNDVKLMAQAQAGKAEYYLTADTESKRMYDILQQQGKVDFQFIDIRTSVATRFGIINIDNHIDKQVTYYLFHD